MSARTERLALVSGPLIDDAPGIGPRTLSLAISPASSWRYLTDLGDEKTATLPNGPLPDFASALTIRGTVRYLKLDGMWEELMAASTVQITDTNFETEVLKSTVPVLID